MANLTFPARQVARGVLLKEMAMFKKFLVAAGVVIAGTIAPLSFTTTTSAAGRMIPAIRLNDACGQAGCEGGLCPECTVDENFECCGHPLIIGCAGGWRNCVGPSCQP